MFSFRFLLTLNKINNATPDDVNNPAIVEAKEIVQGEIYQQITPKNKYPCMLTSTESKELFDKFFS